MRVSTPHLRPHFNELGTRLIRVEGGVVCEETHRIPRFSKGKYRVPNESNVFAARAALTGTGQSGSLLTTGSLRGILGSVFAGPEYRPDFHTYVVDVDPYIIDFHHGHLQRAPSYTTPEMLAEGLTAQLGGESDLAEFFGQKRGQWELTPMGSTAALRTHQRLAAEERYVPINGSIAGTESVPSLAAALHKSGERIGAVDLSNIPNYLDAAATAQLLRNLKALPLADDARVFFSFNNEKVRSEKSDLPKSLWPSGGKQLDEFHFTVLTATDFIRLLEKAVERKLPGEIWGTRIAELAIKQGTGPVPLYRDATRVGGQLNDGFDTIRSGAERGALELYAGISARLENARARSPPGLAVLEQTWRNAPQWARESLGEPKS